MVKSIQRKTERSPQEAVRLRELRERYQSEKPSIADLAAKGAKFAPLGEVILLRGLAGELRRERERQRLTLEQMARRLPVSPDVLNDIETGTSDMLTLGMLCRMAHALGKQIACSLVERVV